MKKNVWIMNHYAGGMLFDQGGRHYNFAKYLKQAGYEPVVFCANSRHNAEGHWYENNVHWHVHDAEEIGVPFVFVAARSYTGNGKQRVLNMADFYRNVKKAAKEYARQNGKPDIIYASSVHPLTLVAGIQLAKHFGVKCICEVRDLWPESIVAYSDRLTKKNPVIKLLYAGEKWIYTKADELLFTGEGCYDYIVERGWDKRIPRAKVHYINNGIDMELFLYNREKYRIRDEDLENPDTFKVVYTGSIRKVNNLGLLLDAAKETHDARIRFLIWGDGDELQTLRERIEKEHIANVIFKGKVAKKFVPYIVSQADLNLAHNTPSPLFRFGISFNKMFDYLAAGKPVLSDFPCKYNPSVQFGAGIDVREPTASSVAQAVEAMAQLSEVEYNRFCERASSAAQEFDFCRLTDRLLKVIQGTEVQ